MKQAAPGVFLRKKRTPNEEFFIGRNCGREFDSAMATIEAERKQFERAREILGEFRDAAKWGRR